MNRKELIELLDKYEIEYEITDNTKEVEEGLRLFDEALEKIGIIIPKETQIDNIIKEDELEVPKYTTEWASSSDLPVEPELVSGDTISKEALIQSFLADCECKDRSEAKAVTCSLDTMLELIDDAPPVEPPKKVVAQIKVDTDEIVERIKEEYEIKDLPVCEDAISRADTIKAMCSECTQEGYDECREDCTEVAVVKSMPPVEPERPKGEWQITINQDYRCTNCGKITSTYKANFCPNCGADMRGEK